MKKEKFEAALRNSEIPFHKNLMLKDYTTIKIGGKADYLIEISHSEEILAIIEHAKECKIPYVILGKGSNTMFLDEGFNGVVIILSSLFSKMRVKDNQLIVEAGASLKDICEFAYHHSLMGLEFAYGIPGSIGGATVMNAGAYGGEMKDIIKSVSYYDEIGQLINQVFKKSDFSYRLSPFTNRQVCVVEVELDLSYGAKSAIQERMDDYIQRRIDKQPLEYPSAGSTFKRPVGRYASELIEKCNLKGYRLGGAMISDKHAGFIINYQQASSQDFLDLIAYVKQTVFEKTGCLLQCEMKIIHNINPE